MNLEAALKFLAEQERTECNENIAFRCEASKRLEDAGSYDGACETLGVRWRGAGRRPDVNGLGKKEEALLLLRSGMLSHRIAVTEAREGAQDEAKDILCEAARMFAALGDEMREAEALIGAGLCCWRQSSLDEARILLSEALKLASQGHGEQRATALVALASVEWSAGDDRKALGHYQECRELVERHGSSRLKAAYHSGLALVRRRIGDMDAALIEYAAASYHFEEAGDIRQCAAIENNVGYLLAISRRFDQAHEHYDRAGRLFSRLGDPVNSARVDDSRAQALVTEKKFKEAVKFASRAAEVLEASDDKNAYVETLITLATAHARLGCGPDAWYIFEKARGIALNFISSTAAEKISEMMMDEIGPILYSGLGVTYYVAYRKLQRSLIMRALIDSDWSITKAAFKLGMKQQGLSQLLQGTHKDVLDEKPFH